MKVGLTGNFGMGKSAVLETFKKLGAYTIDADDLVAELFEDPAVLKRMRQVLGDEVFGPDGALLRDAVAEKIFRDESLRLTIEDILHPMVFERLDTILQGVEAEVAVVEVTLIFERSYEDRFDKTITVFTDEQTAIERLEAEGVARDDSMKRLLCQMPAEDKAARSNFSIDNNGTPEETRAQATGIFNTLTGKGEIGPEA